MAITKFTPLKIKTPWSYDRSQSPDRYTIFNLFILVQRTDEYAVLYHFERYVVVELPNHLYI